MKGGTKKKKNKNAAHWWGKPCLPEWKKAQNFMRNGKPVSERNIMQMKSDSVS